MSERDLKDYIVKLNDRNIQRQRETGFTLYAILGATIFCFFYLVDNIPTLIALKNDKNNLNIAIITANTLFILSLIYLSYETLTRKKRITKIFQYREPIEFTIVDSPIFITFGIICFFNFYQLADSKSIWHHWYLIIFGSLTGLNLASPFLMLIVKSIKRTRKKKKGLSVDIIDFTIGNDKMSKTTSVSLLLYVGILLLLTIVTVFDIKLGVNSKTIAEIIKYTSIFFGLLFLVKKITDIKATEKDNNQLEDFEKEIFFENIPNKEIAKRFESEFSGIPFSKWLIDRHKEVIDFFDTKRLEFQSCDLDISDLDNINIDSLPYEYNGRLNQIISEQTRLLNESNDFTQRLKSTFNNLKSFASLNEQETQDLFYVQGYLNNNIRSFDSQYTNLSNKITYRQNKQTKYIGTTKKT